MSTNSVIIDGNSIITETDYRTNNHSDIFYTYVDNVPCSEEALFLISCSS